MVVNSKKTNWLIIFGLFLLCVIPIVAGVLRLGQLSSGIITEENRRFFNAPLPAILHIISMCIFGLIGALQFAPTLRGKNKWHRYSGQVIFISGIISALTGLYMAQFYALPKTDGIILYVERLIVGIAMLISLILGYKAIKNKNIKSHSEWMLRGYAIGMGAGTQVVTNLPWILLIGQPTTFERAILMGLGWGINIIVAELIIRRSNANKLALA